MGLGHRVSHLTDLDNNFIAGDLDYRHMLFTGGIGGVGNQLDHRLAAADHANAAVRILGDDVAAGLTFIELLRHRNQRSFSIT